MCYCVYVLYDQRRFYIGFTRDVRRRLREHLNGKVHTTKRYNQRKLKLVYTETFISKQDAERREKYFKTTKGRKGLKLILRETLKEIDIQ